MVTEIFPKRHIWGQLSRNPEVRTSKFCNSSQNDLRASDVWKMTRINSSEVSRFRGQNTREIEIVMQGTMFYSPYRSRQSRYSRHFTAIDTLPACLQGDQKSSVNGWKCPHYRRSKLVYFSNLCDFGQLWRAIVRSLIQMGGRVIPRWNRLAELKKTPLTVRA